jgi:sugar phosphate isomerase/epimerase
VKIAYAFRGNRSYPFPGDAPGNELPPEPQRAAYLARVKALGVDGVELGPTSFGGASLTEASARDMAAWLRDQGTPVVCIRGGGGFDNPRTAARNRQHWEQNIKLAAWTGANLVNSTVCTGQRNPRAAGMGVGEPLPQNSSRMASTADFEANARELKRLGALAADHGVTISIEVHQHSLADNSWSANHLLDLVDHPSVGVNPDLGNILWNYDVPEESSEQAIVALAPRATYWHCKNLFRVYLPHDERTVFIRTPLADGDIDYRFAIAAMKEANYGGYLAIEGANAGDIMGKDRRSVEFVRSVLADLG